LHFGFGRADKGLVTSVLPWLLIGRAETAESLQTLVTMGVTHIMNATDEVPNHHSQHFVYMKIPILDVETADAGPKLHPAADFIRRVEDKKGRVS